MSTSKTRFIALIASIPVTFVICTVLWTNAASAAETTRQPGHCVTSEVLVTDKKTGEQHIAVKTVCECSEQNPCTTVGKKVASR